MMTCNAIWKVEAPLQGPGMFRVKVPVGAKILDVQKQGDVPVMWFLIDRGLFYIGENHRDFVWIATGQEFTASKLQYIKTFQDGPLVFHLHEVLP